MMNPFIYSLRNKDVKLALRKILRRRKFWLESVSVQVVIGEEISVHLFTLFLMAAFLSYFFLIMAKEIWVFSQFISNFLD